MKEYVRQIERAIAVRKLVAKDSRDSKPQAKEKKRKREDDNKLSVASSPQKKTKSPQKPARKPCKHCGKYHLNEDKCWSLNTNKHLHPSSWTDKKKDDSNRGTKETSVRIDFESYRTSLARRKVTL